MIVVRYCWRVILLCAVHCQVSAQESRWLIGTGITYCSYLGNPGVNFNVTYRAIGNLHIGPDFSAILNDERVENGKRVIRKELEYNINANYVFEIKKWIGVYPLAGINYSKVTIHPEGEEPDKRWITAFNSGGGLEVSIKTVRLYLESKYVTRLEKYDLTIGVLIDL